MPRGRTRSVAAASEEEPPASEEQGGASVAQTTNKKRRTTRVKGEPREGDLGGQGQLLDGGFTEQQLWGIASEENPCELVRVYKEALQEAAERVALSSAEYDSLVRSVVRHVLFRQHARRGEPIPRLELTEVVSQGNKKKGAPKLVLLAAQLKLAEAFGLHLKEVARHTVHKGGGGAGAGPSTQGGDVSGTKVFLLRTLVPPPLRRRFLPEEEEAAAGRGLALAVLALVKLSGGQLQEDDLWRHLQQLGVSREPPTHPRLGDAKAALQSLVKQRYLVESRVQGPDGEARRYEWGEHAGDDFPGPAIDRWVRALVAPAGQRQQEAA